MASNVLYEENAFDDVARANYERTTAVIDSVLRAKRGRQAQQPVDPTKPSAAILPIYLREMGSTPLIDEHQEVDLARELQESREERQQQNNERQVASPAAAKLPTWLAM